MVAWGHNRIMADVKIRKLPEWVVVAFKDRAAHRGRSLEEELRSLLTEAASKPKQDRTAEMAAFARTARHADDRRRRQRRSQVAAPRLQWARGFKPCGTA